MRLPGRGRFASAVVVGALAGIVFATIVVIGVLAVQGSLRAGDTARRDREAAERHEQLREALVEVQVERGLAEAYVATRRPAELDAYRNQARATDAAVAALAVVGDGTSAEDLPARLQLIRDAVTGGGDLSFDLYSDVLRVVVNRMADLTSMSRESRGFAAGRARDVLVDAAEVVAQRRGAILGQIMRNEPVDQQLDLLVTLFAADYRALTRDAARLVSPEQRSQVASLPNSAAAEAVARLLDQLLSGRAPSAEQWFDSSTRQLDEVYALVAELTDLERSRADDARAEARRDVATEAATFGGLAAAVAAIGWAAVSASRERTEALVQHEGLAEGLRRWFHPAAFADVPGISTDAVYAPAADHAQAGGDWFDLFVIDGGLVVAGIGDVAGHGPDAVAHMATLRNMLRGQAMSNVAGGPVPVERLVEDLDRSAAAVDILASLLYCVWDPVGHRLTYSRAGHPPGLLVEPSGAVTLLGDGEDTMVGVRQRTPRTAHTVTVAPGSSVVLYTDGIIESPESTIDDSIRCLVEHVAAHPPEEGRSVARDLLDRRPRTADDAAVLILTFDIGVAPA